MRTILPLCFLMMLLNDGLAQNSYLYGAWNYQVPLSNRSWLNEPSGSGGALGYRFFMRDQHKVSVGIDFNWITFDQYAPRETFTTTNGATTTDYFKYIYAYGLTLSGQYYIPLSDNVFPYVSLGLGANSNSYTLYYNIYTDQVREWGFLARPEAGIVVRFSPHGTLGAMAAVHFDYSTNKAAEFGYENFMSAGFKLGLVLMSR